MLVHISLNAYDTTVILKSHSVKQSLIVDDNHDSCGHCLFKWKWYTNRLTTKQNVCLCVGPSKELFERLSESPWRLRPLDCLFSQFTILVTCLCSAFFPLYLASILAPLSFSLIVLFCLVVWMFRFCWRCLLSLPSLLFLMLLSRCLYSSMHRKMAT